jgi:hypothetical protein
MMTKNQKQKHDQKISLEEKIITEDGLDIS